MFKLRTLYKASLLDSSLITLLSHFFLSSKVTKKKLRPILTRNNYISILFLSAFPLPFPLPPHHHCNKRMELLLPEPQGAIKNREYIPRNCAT